MHGIGYLCFSGVLADAEARDLHFVHCSTGTAPRNFLSTISPQGKYQTLPPKKKVAAIQEVDAGVKKTEVALKYGIAKSTLTTLLKAKDKLQNNASRFAPDRKRLGEVAYPDLGKALLLWFKRARSSNLPVSGPILREKAARAFLALWN